MPKTGTLIATALCLALCGCPFFVDGKEKSTYRAKIVWASEITRVATYTLHGDSVYYYGAMPDFVVENVGDILKVPYYLTKISAETGELLWHSEFAILGIQYVPPAVIGNSVYAFMIPDGIFVFDCETGKHTATVAVRTGHYKSDMDWNTVSHGNYLYMGFYPETGPNSFARLDVNRIKYGGDPDELQIIKPEILWQPENRSLVASRPVAYGNAVYTGTFYLSEGRPVELAGFDIDTGEMVFHAAFGGTDEDDGTIVSADSGSSDNPIFIHDGVLYYMGVSVSAWNLNTRERLYRHVFPVADAKNFHGSDGHPEAVLYDGKIIMVTSNSRHFSEDSFPRIQAIDMATGRLAWRTRLTALESQDTNPIIVNGRLYTSHHDGFHVFDPANGNLIGVDKSFSGSSSPNFLYNGRIITVKRLNRDRTFMQFVAVDVGR